MLNTKEPHATGKMMIRPLLVDSFSVHAVSKVRKGYTQAMLPTNIAFIVHARNFPINDKTFKGQMIEPSKIPLPFSSDILYRNFRALLERNGAMGLLRTLKNVNNTVTNMFNNCLGNSKNPWFEVLNFLFNRRFRTID